MKLRQKTRTDYHTFYPYDEDGEIRHFAHRWLKPILWLVLGFMFGTLYHKSVNVQNCEMLAFSTESKAADLQSPNKKGSRTSSKA